MTKEMRMEALLLNPHSATQVNTSLGQALYIPRQISERDAGRKSLYYLKPGEETLTGIYVIGSDIYYRVMRWDTGQGTPAQTGDQYTQRITNLQGEAVAEFQGILTVLDASKGIGSRTQPLSCIGRR